MKIQIIFYFFLFVNISPVGDSQLALDLIKIAVASLQAEISLKSVNEHYFVSFSFLDKKQSVSEHPMWLIFYQALRNPEHWGYLSQLQTLNQSQPTSTNLNRYQVDTIDEHHATSFDHIKRILAKFKYLKPIELISTNPYQQASAIQQTPTNPINKFQPNQFSPLVAPDRS